MNRNACKIAVFLFKPACGYVVVVALKAPSQPYDEYVCHLHREIPPPPVPPRGANTDGTLACQSGHQRCLVKMISMTMKNSGSIQKKYL